MTRNPSFLPFDFITLERLGRPVSPAVLDRLSHANLPWHETPEVFHAALVRSRRNARLLDWVRAQMLLRLTPVERRCIELYFFEDRNYREAAEVLGVNVTSVYRGVRRGLRKLRKAAEDHPPRPFSGRARKSRLP